MKRVVVTFSLIMVFAVAALAEDHRSELSVQGTGFFTKEAANNGRVQDATHSGGVLTGYRYYLTPVIGVEANYGYARNTQRYSGSGTSARVQANVHEITGALVFRTRPFAEKFRAFGLTGGGALIFDPTNEAGGAFPGTTSDAKGTFLYGGGVDYELNHRWALRGEYRGLVYSSPRFGLAALDTDKITHAAQPAAGIVFRF